MHYGGNPIILVPPDLTWTFYIDSSSQWWRHMIAVSFTLNTLFRKVIDGSYEWFVHTHSYRIVAGSLAQGKPLISYPITYGPRVINMYVNLLEIVTMFLQYFGVNIDRHVLKHVTLFMETLGLGIMVNSLTPSDAYMRQ